MPKLMILLVVLLIGSWLLMGEKKPFGEKIGILVVLIVLYVGFRLMTGASLEEVLAPLRELSTLTQTPQ